MSNVTEWLANLNTATVLIVMAVLLALRFALLPVKSQAAKSVAEIAESLAIAMGLVFLIIRPFFVQAFFIPSESMLSTLRVHDHILVNKTVYLMRAPKPGEIAVFAAPPEALHGEMLEAQLNEGKQTDYIKRVTGAPGDTIRVEPGYISVNGAKLTREALRTIYQEYKAEKHVGVYRFWTVDMDRVNRANDSIGQVVDKMIAAFARGDQPSQGFNGPEIDGIPIKESPVVDLGGFAIGPSGPSVRLGMDGVYVDGRKLTDQEARKPFPTSAKVEINPGYVVRNGKVWDQPYLGEDAESAYPITEIDPTDLASSIIAPAVNKAVADKKIELVQDSTGHLAAKLMPGQYLMMGDNRNNSSDGRFWGPVERWRLKGRPLFTFFPMSRFGWVR